MRTTVGGWATGVVLFLLLAMGLLFPWAAVAVPSAEQTPPPTVTAKPVDAPPLSPPTATPSPSLLVSPLPTATPPSQPIPWLPPDLIRLIADYRLKVGLSCLLLFLLLLAIVLILVIWRGGQRRVRRPTVPPRPPGAQPPPPAAAPPLAYLQSVAAPGNPRFDLRPAGVTIGRSAENDLVITQDFPGWATVSQRHARIYRWADRWIVEDLQSTNGVYVNGRRTGRNVLHSGWRIGIGGVEFDFHASTEEAER